MYACKIQNWKFGSVLTTAFSLIQEKPIAEFAIMQSWIDSALSIVVKKIKMIQKN